MKTRHYDLDAVSRAGRQRENGGEGMKLAARLVALLFLLAPATVHAECAWVLWVRDVRDLSTLGPSVFEPQESYTAKKERLTPPRRGQRASDQGLGSP